MRNAGPEGSFTPMLVINEGLQDLFELRTVALVACGCECPLGMAVGKLSYHYAAKSSTEWREPSY